jgi:hypothetical protein
MFVMAEEEAANTIKKTYPARFWIFSMQQKKIVGSGLVWL